MLRRRLHRILQASIRPARHFAAEKSGSVAMSVALTALPLILIAGAAADYSDVHRIRSNGQSALDSAVLAIAVKGTLDTALGNSVFQGNLSLVNATAGTPAFTSGQAADNNPLFTGTATITAQTRFMGIIGFKTMTIGLQSQAKSKPSTPEITSATFKPTRAQGAYSKDIFIWTKDSTGKITSETTVMTYRYSSKTGKKITTPSLESVSTTFYVQKYGSFGVGLVIYEDYTNYSGALINPKKKYSDATDAANWIKSSGQCNSPNGQAVQMEDGHHRKVAGFAVF